MKEKRAAIPMVYTWKPSKYILTCVQHYFKPNLRPALEPSKEVDDVNGDGAAPAPLNKSRGKQDALRASRV